MACLVLHKIQIAFLQVNNVYKGYVFEDFYLPCILVNYGITYCQGRQPQHQGKLLGAKNVMRPRGKAPFEADSMLNPPKIFTLFTLSLFFFPLFFFLLFFFLKFFS